MIGSTVRLHQEPELLGSGPRSTTTTSDQVYADPQTQVNAIKGGQVNGLNADQQHATPRSRPAGYTLFPHELDWAGLMLMDRAGTMNPALGNVKVRQAINYAIDRGRHAQGLRQGLRHRHRPDLPARLARRTTRRWTRCTPSTRPRPSNCSPDAGYAGGVHPRPCRRSTIGTTVQYDLIKQYLGASASPSNYTPMPINNSITDLLAPKYAASWFILQQDPTAWQLANFSIAPTATFNPFHSATRRSTG